MKGIRVPMERVIELSIPVLRILLLIFILTGGNYLIANSQDILVELPLPRQTSVQSESRFLENTKRMIQFSDDKMYLGDAIKYIADKADLKLSYSEELIPVSKLVSLKQELMSVEDALWLVLEGTSLRYGISSTGQLFFLKRNDNLYNNIIQQAVTGLVTDAQTGEVLPGVNVVIKGTQRGTTSDLNGIYKLTVDSLQDTLIFSYIGYESRVVPINGQAEVDVEMEPQILTSEELIVIGYGTQRKSDLTGSVSSISERDFHPGMNNSVGELLQGKVAGVEISQTSGEPGSGLSIRIRGVGSINAGTSPLSV